MWDSTLTRLKLLLRGIKYLPSDCKDELQSVCHKLSFEPKDVKYSDQSEVWTRAWAGLTKLKKFYRVVGFCKAKKKYLEEKQINYTFQIKYFTMSGGEGWSCCSLSNLKKILLFSRFMQLCCNIYATKVQSAKHIGHWNYIKLLLYWNTKKWKNKKWKFEWL